MPEGFMNRIPRIFPGNYGKWQSALSERQLGQIGPVLEQPLVDLGYEAGGSWYKPSP